MAIVAHEASSLKILLYVFDHLKRKTRGIFHYQQP